jgi:hypothetical protein
MKVSLSFVAVTVLASFTAVRAETYKVDATSGSWLDTSKWVEGTYPNGVGANASFGSQVTKTVSLNSNITLGSIFVDTNSGTLAGSRTTTIANGTAAPITADYNGNGIVDAADFVLWRKDPTNVGGGDPAGYDAWRAQFGNTGIAGLTFDAVGTGPATINIPEGNSTGKMPITATMFLQDNLVATVGETAVSGFDGALRLQGAMSGPGGLTKLGDGLLNMEGTAAGNFAKTYTGPTVLSGGRNRIIASNSPTMSSSFTVDGSAQLELSSDGVFTLGASTLFLNGNGTGAASGGIIRPDRTTTAGRSLTITNPIELQTNSIIHSQTQSAPPAPQAGSATGYIALAGVVSGSAKLQLTAPSHNEQLGTYYLQNQNTHSGGTELYGGKLVVGDEFGTYPNANLGTGDVTIYSAEAPFGIVVNGAARGFLEIDNGVLNAIADNRTLTLGGSFVPNNTPDDGYVFLDSLINETVGGLVLGGVAQLVAGTYGSTSSLATFQNNEFFAGTGIITLVLPPGSGSGLETVGGVPEPTTIALVGLGIALVGFSRRRRVALSA